MRRVVDVLYGLKGYPNAVRFAEFKTDFFANGGTPPMTIDTAGVNGLTISAAMSGSAILLSGTSAIGVSFTGTSSGACIDFGPASVTTGTLIDYVGIVGKTSGYLFNGTMTTSVLTGSTLIDDFACTCASDGLAADTLRMIRRQWSGEMPNGTAAVNFILAEFVWAGGVFGSNQTKGGNPKLMNLACTTTFDDTGANFTALNVDISGMTLTRVANVYGISIATMTGVDAAINTVGNATAILNVTSGTITSVIDILAAANITNLVKFNAAAGCVGAADVSCAGEPSDGGLGADGHIVIAIGATPYYIPIFNSLT